jgi:hypothetical protein
MAVIVILDKNHLYWQLLIETVLLFNMAFIAIGYFTIG